VLSENTVMLEMCKELGFDHRFRSGWLCLFLLLFAMASR
jgi:hypothetical protein